MNTVLQRMVPRTENIQCAAVVRVKGTRTKAELTLGDREAGGAHIQPRYAEDRHEHAQHVKISRRVIQISIRPDREPLLSAESWELRIKFA